LYVSSHDFKGQQFNGYLLLEALRKQDIDARMFVHESRIDRPGVIYSPQSKIRRNINRGLAGLENQLSLYSVLPIHSSEIVRNGFYQEADIVHLQLIHPSRFISLFHLPRMGREKTLVFTLHDPWLLTGHCVHPIECERWMTGCGNCPDLTRTFPIKADTTAFTWQLKNLIMKRTNIHLIVTSEWMEDKVKNSPILSHLPYSNIPLGLDIQVFKPHDKKACKEFLGIPTNAFVIAFRAVPSSEFKGVKYIQEALLRITDKSNIYLVTFDSKGVVPELTKEYKTIELDWIHEPAIISGVLNAADVFLMPSLAESFGMMAVEAMACGTPVIVFEGTALPSTIHAPHGGIAVPAKDSLALQRAIETLMSTPGLRSKLSHNGLQIVRKEYTLEKHVSQHLELYKQLVSAQRY
jgi:glycosyltransferase involved in cell wall biosynthesis